MQNEITIIKNIKQLDLVNAAALDQELGEEFGRLILETLLQRQIGKIHITAQKTLQGILPEKRGSGWMWRFWKGKIRNQE